MTCTRCKFRCVEAPAPTGGKLVLEAQYDPDSDKDKSFTVATPWGRLEAQIDNPKAIEAMNFEPGKCYFVDISPV